MNTDRRLTDQPFKNWKEELIFLHLDSIRQKAPGFFKASGGFEMKIKPYCDTNTNGLTRCVKEFLTFKGHYCIRTNRQGQARTERIPIGGTQLDITGRGVKYNSKVTYTKNPEGKAFADLQASIEGLFVSIEIKCKAKKDRTMEGQEENKTLVELSGGILLIVPDMEYFYNWYNTELPNIIKSKLK